MSEELKPCPFCGSQGEEIGLCYNKGKTPAEGSDWFVRCYACHVEFPCADTEAEAITAWNRRASPRVEDVRREALEEAAKKLEVLAIDYEERAEVSAADRHYRTAAYQKREADTLLIASTLIRSLSPPDGDGKQEQARPSGSAPISHGNEGHD